MILLRLRKRSSPYSYYLLIDKTQRHNVPPETLTLSSSFSMPLNRPRRLCESTFASWLEELHLRFFEELVVFEDAEDLEQV